MNGAPESLPPVDGGVAAVCRSLLGEFCGYSGHDDFRQIR